MAGNKDQIAVFRAGLRPLEIVRDFHRLIVFINSHQRHIEIEARKIEVVGVAAKEGRLKLGANTSRTSVNFL